MARRKMSKLSKRNVQDIKRKIVGFLFAGTVLFMAGYSITEGYSSSLETTQESVALGKEQSFIQLILPVSQKMYELYTFVPASALRRQFWNLTGEKVNWRRITTIFMEERPLIYHVRY